MPIEPRVGKRLLTGFIESVSDPTKDDAACLFVGRLIQSFLQIQDQRLKIVMPVLLPDLERTKPGRCLDL